jgi:hypothetical protein
VRPVQTRYVHYGSKVDLTATNANVRFVPEADICNHEQPLKPILSVCNIVLKAP